MGIGTDPGKNLMSRRGPRQQKWNFKSWSERTRASRHEPFKVLFHMFFNRVESLGLFGTLPVLLTMAGFPKRRQEVTQGCRLPIHLLKPTCR